MSGDTWRRRFEDAYAAPESAGARRLACLVGGAIGDALGYRVEFDRWPAMNQAQAPGTM